jgi:signal peptidase I
MLTTIILIFLFISIFFVQAGVFYFLSKIFKLKNNNFKKSLIASSSLYFVILISVLLKTNSLISILILVFNFIIFQYILKKYNNNKLIKNLGIYICLIISISFIILPIFIIFTRLFIVFPTFINSDEMEPLLQNKEYFLINKLDFSYKKDEIIMFKSESGNNLIRKIIGLPFEEVELNNTIKKLNQDQYLVISEKNKNSQIINQSSIIGSYFFSFGVID